MCNHCECCTVGCRKYLDYKNRFWYNGNSYCSSECIKKNIFKEFDPPFDEKGVSSDSDIKFECLQSVIKLVSCTNNSVYFKKG